MFEVRSRIGNPETTRFDIELLLSNKEIKIETGTKMKSGPIKTLLCIFLTLALASVVSSCGRRGNLERPPSATVISVDEEGREVTEEQEPAEDKPFILDPLL